MLKQTVGTGRTDSRGRGRGSTGAEASSSRRLLSSSDHGAREELSRKYRATGLGLQVQAHCNGYLWCWQARGPMLQAVKRAKAKAGKVPHITAKPLHSKVSPKKLAPDTYRNIPPEMTSTSSGQSSAGRWSCNDSSDSDTATESGIK